MGWDQDGTRTGTDAVKMGQVGSSYTWIQDGLQQAIQTAAPTNAALNYEQARLSFPPVTHAVTIV